MTFEFGTTSAPVGPFDDWNQRSYPWLPADDPYQERYRRARAALQVAAPPEQIRQILREPPPPPPCDKPCCARRPEGGGL